MSSTGMSAAPVTPTRRLEMSRRRAVGMVEQRVVDRRRPGQHRDPLALDDLEHDARVEHREREDRRAAHEAREAAGLVAEDVEERVRDQVAVAGAQVGPVAPVEVRAQRLAVRHHDALRVPGRARREHDVARIVGADRRDARVEVARRAPRVPRATKSSQRDRGGVGLAREQDRVLERGQLDAGAREQRRVVGVEEPAHGEERPRAAAREDVRRLRAPEARVDRHEHAARGRDAERGDDPLERVRRPHRDPVAALDARRDAARAPRRRPWPRSVGEGDAPVAVDDGLGVAPTRRAPSRTIAGIVGHVTSLRTCVPRRRLRERDQRSWKGALATTGYGVSAWKALFDCSIRLEQSIACSVRSSVVRISLKSVKCRWTSRGTTASGREQVPGTADVPEASESSTRWSRGWLFLPLLPLIGFILFSSTGEDDAYITYWKAARSKRRGASRTTTARPRAVIESAARRASRRGVLVDACSVPTVGGWFSVVAGAACAPVAYRFGRRLEPRSGWIAAAVVATTPPLVYWRSAVSRLHSRPHRALGRAERGAVCQRRIECRRRDALDLRRRARPAGDRLGARGRVRTRRGACCGSFRTRETTWSCGSRFVVAFAAAVAAISVVGIAVFRHFYFGAVLSAPGLGKDRNVQQRGAVYVWNTLLRSGGSSS